MFARDLLASHQWHHQCFVILSAADSVNARYAGHDEAVAPGEYGAGGGVAARGSLKRGAKHATWAEGFEAEPLSDEEGVADAHDAGDQVAAAFYDPLSEQNLVR